MFAFSPLIWLYAVGAEVFSLNNLFVALLLHGTLKYASTKSQGWLIYGALLCGLALCNQHTAVLYIVPLVAWILWTYRARLSFILMVRLVCAGVIGLSPYVFLWYSDTYARSRGSWGDCSTLDGFLRHFLRKGATPSHSLGRESSLTCRHEQIMERSSCTLATQRRPVCWNGTSYTFATSSLVRPRMALRCSQLLVFGFAGRNRSQRPTARKQTRWMWKRQPLGEPCLAHGHFT